MTNPTPPASSPDNDFNPKQAFEALSADIQQPERFAKIFCNAAKGQKSIDVALRKVVRNLIKSDLTTIDAIKEYQRQVNKEDWKNFIKQGGGVVKTIFLLALGAILQALSKKYLS